MAAKVNIPQKSRHHSPEPRVDFDVFLNDGSHRKRKIHVTSTNKTNDKEKNFLDNSTEALNKVPIINVLEKEKTKHRKSAGEKVTKTKSRHRIKKTASATNNEFSEKLGPLNDDDLFYMNGSPFKGPERKHKHREKSKSPNSINEPPLEPARQEIVRNKKREHKHKKKVIKEEINPGLCDMYSNQVFQAVVTEKIKTLRPKSGKISTKSKLKILQQSRSTVNLEQYQKNNPIEEIVENHRKKKNKSRKTSPKKLKDLTDYADEKTLLLDALSTEKVPIKEKPDTIPKKTIFEYDFRNYLQAIHKIIDEKLETIMKCDLINKDVSPKEPILEKKPSKHKKKHRRKSKEVNEDIEKTEKIIIETTKHDHIDVASISCTEFKRKKSRHRRKTTNETVHSDKISNEEKEQHGSTSTSNPKDNLVAISKVNVLTNKELLETTTNSNHIIIRPQIKENNFVVEGIEPAKLLHSPRKQPQSVNKRVKLECKTVAIVGIIPKNDIMTCEELVEKKKKSTMFTVYYGYFGDSPIKIKLRKPKEDYLSDSNKPCAGSTDYSDRCSEDSKSEAEPSKDCVVCQYKKTDFSSESSCFDQLPEIYLTKNASSGYEKRKIVPSAPDESKLKNIDEEPCEISSVSCQNITSYKEKTTTWLKIASVCKMRSYSDISLQYIKKPAFSDGSFSTLEEIIPYYISENTNKSSCYNESYLSQTDEKNSIIYQKDLSTCDFPKKLQTKVERSVIDSSNFSEDFKLMNKQDVSNKNNLHDELDKEETKSDMKNFNACSEIQRTTNIKPLTKWADTMSKKPIIPNSESKMLSGNATYVPLREQYIEKRKIGPKQLKTICNRSKSDLNVANLKRLSLEQKSKSVMNLLIEENSFANVEKFVTHSKNRYPKLASITNSSEQNGDKQTHTSSFFLTKNFKGPNTSSYEKRKSYDESIRKKFKKKLEQNKNKNQKFFEVRYMTVEKSPFKQQSQIINRPSPCSRTNSFLQQNSPYFIKKQECQKVDENRNQKSNKNVAVHYRKITEKTKDEAVVCKLIQSPQPTNRIKKRHPASSSKHSASTMSDNFFENISVNSCFTNSRRLHDIYSSFDIVNESKNCLNRTVSKNTSVLEVQSPITELSENSVFNEINPKFENLLNYLCESLNCDKPLQNDVFDDDQFEPPRKKRAIKNENSNTMTTPDRIQTIDNSFKSIATDNLNSVNNCAEEKTNSSCLTELKQSQLMFTPLENNKVQKFFEDSPTEICSNKNLNLKRFITGNVSCPALKSQQSFDFLYESSDICTGSDSGGYVEEIVDYLTEKREFLDTIPVKKNCVDSTSQKSSGESGYASINSRKFLSLTNFFKRPNIAALFKNPSSIDTVRKERTDILFLNSQHCDSKKNCDVYEKMTKDCKSFAHKVKVQSETSKHSIHSDNYKEIPLSVMLGTPSKEEIKINPSKKNSCCSQPSSCESVTEINENKTSKNSLEESEEKIILDDAPSSSPIQNNEIDTIEFLTTKCVRSISTTKSQHLSLNELELISPVISLSHLEQNDIFLEDNRNIMCSKENISGNSAFIEKSFYQNLLNVYEREINLTLRLAEDENFFENELLNVVNKSSTVKSNKKHQFKNFFKRKSKQNPVCASTKSSKESDCGEFCDIESKSSQRNFNQLQTMASNVKRYFSSLAQAVMFNHSMTDEIKVCGFLKLLERIENGDFTLLNSEEDINFENEIKSRMKQAFAHVYECCASEAKKIKRKILPNDLEIIKLLISKYHMGCTSHFDLLASYIGKGSLHNEKQLKAAVTYLVRSNCKEVNEVEFENFWKFA